MQAEGTQSASGLGDTGLISICVGCPPFANRWGKQATRAQADVIAPDISGTPRWGGGRTAVARLTAAAAF
jgi:hypothetical protein